MKIAAIAFTEQGMKLGARLQAMFSCLCLERCTNGMLNEWTKSAFQNAGAIVFIGAIGIAVRAIAPYIQRKTIDPAVIVMDELGQFVIPVLSGHIGGANELAHCLGQCVGAQPVITTATDIHHMFAVDVWAKEQGLFIENPERIKNVSAKLLSGDKIRIKSPFPIRGEVPERVSLEDSAYDILVTHQAENKEDVLRLIAPVVTVGIGCRKGISVDAVEEAFCTMLSKANCHLKSVVSVASIDLKKGEFGIQEFCRRHNFPLKTFSAQELSKAEGAFASSSFVEEVTGVDNVCERAAVLASNGRLLLKKSVINGVTIALAIMEPELNF